ncbi:MAG TPA: TetR/AcrR family transcriptional regulator [Phototrophicaceae bacterium]|jgi:AcrR family transcriptional regulator|nr:TetR/AcrR family transcriptional regulator [Phototrophicaceae bacterium]
MKTRDRILDAAVTLFNDQGTSPVSTNHIAESAGISSGNLYYHFRNKEEIIRAIFERLYALWDVTFVLAEDRMPTIEDAEGLVRANFIIMWDYRFIYREILALLRQDEQLHASYIAVRQRGYEGFQELIAVLAEARILNISTDSVIVTRLADLCWLISEFWLAEVEVSGQLIDESQMQRGLDLMLEVLRPYRAD